jgi:glyoxylase-like metal-dependent hydrolase (beta-lactamase superfamily II)
VLCVGDYLSRLEIPWISKDGSLVEYRATLARLGPLVAEADTVVPGHGPPHSGDVTSRLLEEDLEYLDTLGRGEERPRLPEGRDTSFQRWIHSENLARV